MVCTECSTVMRREIKMRNTSGKLDSVMYFCDTDKCRYGIRISGQHANSQNAPYEPPAVITAGMVMGKDRGEPFSFSKR
jgi:hypothetical protein